ncbi:MAG: DUF4395 domain-containing protein [Acidimicrobiales bacterium]
MSVSTKLPAVLRFPNPVNEKAARTVAAFVLVICIATIAWGQGWLLVPLAAGFWLRALTGPRISPLALMATRVVAPRLGEPKLVAGPPKRFAQGMGVAFSTTALVLWFGAGLHTAALVVTGLLAAAAFLESALAVCLGCQVFGLLMRAGVIPEEVCVACADISLRHPQLRQPIGV